MIGTKGEKSDIFREVIKKLSLAKEYLEAPQTVTSSSESWRVLRVRPPTPGGSTAGARAPGPAGGIASPLRGN